MHDFVRVRQPRHFLQRGSGLSTVISLLHPLSFLFSSYPSNERMRVDRYSAGACSCQRLQKRLTNITRVSSRTFPWELLRDIESLLPFVEPRQLVESESELRKIHVTVMAVV